ncbi:hypothetical protein K458DRAFT_281518, partial [Lentithecium fluviatile CBS 122367]
PHLVLTGRMQKPWISLSHCWGKMKGLKTTKDNYKDFLQSIPLHKLLATIHDAIVFTQRLGFRYLWIDSLCVIQPKRKGDVDDQKDWANELPNMVRYYKHAAATLVSSSLSRLGQGANSWQREAVLAPRKVYVFGDQLIWSCQHFAVHDRILYDCQDVQQPQIGRSLLTLDARRSAILDHWYVLLQDFRQRDITFPSDRLPAISATATELEIQLKMRYRVGIWLEDAARGVSWVTDGKSTRPSDRQLPSWSWASV